MTSDEAMQQAKDSMSDADLKRFRLTRVGWEETVDWLAGAYGIYPDGDPRNEKYEDDSLP
jgi:hypothetical protein